MSLEDDVLYWVTWLQDAREAIRRDKCSREDYIAMHKPSAQEDAARAYDAVVSDSWQSDRRKAG
jgi:hypothetical protein